MNPEQLKRAQDALEIQEVVQRSCAASLATDYVPTGDSSEGIVAEFKHLVVRSEVLEAVEQDGAMRYVFRVFIDLGVRWSAFAKEVAESSSVASESSEADSEEDATSNVLGEIAASYVAQYSLSDSSVDQGCLDEFALHNASYHVWPYFREFVTSQCSRMAAPRITLPMVHFAANRDQTAEKE